MDSCFLYQADTDSGGQPIFRVQCYCGTTSCQRVNELNLKTCGHYWYRCEPETDDIEHCRNCGRHRNPAQSQATK